jgi:hypothetical protein
MSVPQTIHDLVERFERQLDAYRSPQYNETQLRREFLDPFFKSLGLDIPYTEYAGRWDEIANVFSRDAVLKGSFDKFAESNKAKRGTAAVDDEFLKKSTSGRNTIGPTKLFRRFASTNWPLSPFVSLISPTTPTNPATTRW